MARVNATPRRLSRGKGGTGRGRLGVCHLARGLAVLGTRSGEVAPSTLIEHLPCPGGIPVSVSRLRSRSTTRIAREAALGEKLRAPSKETLRCCEPLVVQVDDWH